MSESRVFLSESLIRLFLGKTWAIRSENRWANSQPWKFATAVTIGSQQIIKAGESLLGRLLLTSSQQQMLTQSIF